MAYPHDILHPLAYVRAVLGITQTRLAEILECALVTVKKIETLDLKLSEKMAKKAESALGVSAAYLLAARADRHPITPAGQPFTKAYSGQHQAKVAAGKATETASISPFWTAVKVGEIASTAAKRHRLAYFKFKLFSVLEELEKEFAPDPAAGKHLRQIYNDHKLHRVPAIKEAATR
jgi:hypothetical protein